jgi:ribosomal protein S18 acetylase RimI-like enzyme
MKGAADVQILRAGLEDLPILLEVQRLAYQQQALLCNDFTIPPLTETLIEAREACSKLILLKAVDEKGVMIGSVRGRPEGGTCYIGRLFVHPDCQGQGLGTRLLLEIEAACPFPRYELFTSHLSVDNIRLYERLGYVRFKETDDPAGYKLIYMEKYY